MGAAQKEEKRQATLLQETFLPDASIKNWISIKKKLNQFLRMEKRFSASLKIQFLQSALHIFQVVYMGYTETNLEKKTE